MRSLIRFALCCASLVVVVGLVGCGGQSVYPVKGKITFEGKPMVGGGSIAFMPLTVQAGKAAGGEIAADGSYELMTNRPGDGSMVGDFRVIITQVVSQEPKRTNDGDKVAQATLTVSPKDVIPTIYSDPEQSPLKTKVEAKSLNELNFDLKRADANTRPPGAKAKDRWLRIFAVAP